jgi:transposase
MSQASTRYIGMDVHNDTMAVASVAQDHHAEVVDLGTIGTRQADRDQRIRTMPSQAPHLVFVSDAGPCGAWLSRDRTQKGPHCGVVAPPLMPQKAGERVTTDRRDAVQLARRMRSGALPPVSVPTVAEEARRDLSRARDEASGALKTATFRLNALVLRHDRRYTGRATWGPAPLRWLAAGVWATPAHQLVFQAYVRAVTEPTARLQRRAQALPEQGKSWRRQPGVEALEGRRGGQCTGAVTRVAARGDLTRVEKPRPVRPELGLIPAASARGERRRQGALPTAGKPPARRALVEGAWACRYPATVRRHWPRRWAQLPQPSHDRSCKAHVRLCTRVRRLLARGPHAHPVVVAMARELAGCIGAMATQGRVPPSGHKTPPSGLIPQEGAPRPSEAAPPRCGATRDGVQRPAGALVPRVRQAPDGGQSGGRQPAEISVLNRRMSLAPALPMDLIRQRTSTGSTLHENFYARS